MGAKKWMCAGGGTREPVRVVHGDGQVLSYFTPLKVGEVLNRHPHHYICHMSPELPSNRSAMLSHEDELESGSIYFLLPLPRLFPTSAGTSPSCCCHSVASHDRWHGGANGLNTSGKGGFSPLRVMHIIERIGSPLRIAKKKVSPELARSNTGMSGAHRGKIFGQENSPLLSPTFGARSKGKRSSKRSVSPNSSPNRLRENVNRRNLACREKSGAVEDNSFEENYCSKWKPGLGCISETTSWAFCEEVRQCLDRRRLSFDGKARSPVRSPGRCSPTQVPEVYLSREFDFDGSQSPVHMPLAGFLQI